MHTSSNITIFRVTVSVTIFHFNWICVTFNIQACPDGSKVAPPLTCICLELLIGTVDKFSGAGFQYRSNSHETYDITGNDLDYFSNSDSDFCVCLLCFLLLLLLLLFLIQFLHMRFNTVFPGNVCRYLGFTGGTDFNQIALHLMFCCCCCCCCLNTGLLWAYYNKQPDACDSSC